MKVNSYFALYAAVKAKTNLDRIQFLQTILSTVRNVNRKL